MDSIPEKECSVCGLPKPETSEYFEINGSGLRGQCRDCRKAYKRQMEFIRRQNEYVKERDRLRSPSRKAKRDIYNRKYVQTDKYKEYEKKRNNSIERQQTIRVSFNKRKARKYGLPDTLTTLQWRRCLEYWGYRCAVCGKPAGLWQAIAADHWIPLTNIDCLGTVVENILPLCHGLPGIPNGKPCCNGNKHSKEPIEWLIERLGKRKAMRKLAEIQQYFEWVKTCA